MTSCPPGAGTMSTFWKFKNWVKAGQTRPARFIRSAVELRQTARIPGGRWLGAAIWRVRSVVRPAWLWTKKLVYSEPLVRYRCEVEGRLVMEGGAPNFSGPGRIRLGDRVSLGHRLSFSVGAVTGPDAELVIGPRTRINFETFIGVGRSVVIGADCQISGRVKIMDNTSHPLDPRRRHEGIQYRDCRPIVIEDFVTIGADATVYQGVTIGYGSFIGVNSVVTRDVPPLSIAVGNPARVVGKIEPQGGEGAATEITSETGGTRAPHASSGAPSPEQPPD